MNPSQPPRLGRLVLERLGPRNESIVGDLSEEWHAGRSTLWYWRQVLAGIVFHLVADVRGHWFIALRSILVGLVILWSLGWLVNLVTEQLTRWIVMYPLGVTLVFQVQLGFWIHIGNLAWGSVMGGRVIARLHDRHRAAAILGLVLALGVLAVSNERFVFLIRNSLTHERFVPYLVQYLLQCAVVVTGVLVGGLMQPLTASRAEPPMRLG
jgi:hypothetical protein